MTCPGNIRTKTSANSTSGYSTVKQLNSCYYLLLFSVMMKRFWAAVGFVGLR
jgi:hypothetical protein